ncbi:SAM-dependent methyltransferase (plasmid) [Streptomyces globisporus]|uniref:SAM-dependent methyltransferase n=1 Tax=Streptomyces globisporus TaxID=1908 RepID=UPI002F9085BB|nr:SAM-dependent methyltransferase [Streptomyces globisporus]
MNTTGVTRYAPRWLALREAADAAARASELLQPLRRQLPVPGAPLAVRDRRTGPLVVRDLGSGTGSMGRWLAPRLGGRQHWILHDHDSALLGIAAARLPRRTADGSAVTVATEQGDISRLTAGRLLGTSLVTASALLDLLSEEDLNGLAAACAEAGCPALLTLSVVGRVELGPVDSMDAEIMDAFNAHQRREERGRPLLGPDAVTTAARAFARAGMQVRIHASPWLLTTGPEGASDTGTLRDSPAFSDTDWSGAGALPAHASRALTAEWLRGWVGAAREQRPNLAPRADAYLRRRLEACQAGELRVTVHHGDLLALPRTAGGAP